MFTTDYLDLPPMLRAAGTVVLPGSKSISNRVLLLAGLSTGTTVVHDLLASDDTHVMLEALRALGCEITQDPSGCRITGIGGHLPVNSAQLFLGNAGTAMRPLTAALSLLCTRQPGAVFDLSGVPRMHERPIGDLVDALRPLGCIIEYTGQEGYPPLRLSSGQLQLDQTVRVRGDVSSQFLTALLLALPLVTQHTPITIEVVGELISRPYVDITLKLLARFGVKVERPSPSHFVIPQGAQYQSPGTIHVEGDASSASYFIALGSLAASEDAPLCIEGLGQDSIQGDIAFVDVAKAMGAQIHSGPNTLRICRGSWPLRPIDLDCNAFPDAAMTLAIMALYAQGRSYLRNIASWRVKETDRLTAMATELRKLGAQVHEAHDLLVIDPPSTWQSASIHTYDDHRMAMCFALAAFNPLAGGQATVQIQEPRCVGKTFPNFFETLFQVAQTHASWIPVITVDGPTASGKGTLGSTLAHRLGYAHLDSGALYRATGLIALRQGVSLDDADRLAAIARTLAVRFAQQRTWLNGEDVTDALRAENIGAAASVISAHAPVRVALHELQLSFRQLPGLVADGRDMGTVVFPDAQLKIFLTASAQTRAQRRWAQLRSQGIPAKLDTLLAALRERDARDTSRLIAPLEPAQDAVKLDNSALSAEESVNHALALWQQRPG